MALVALRSGGAFRHLNREPEDAMAYIVIRGLGIVQLGGLQVRLVGVDDGGHEIYCDLAGDMVVVRPG